MPDIKIDVRNKTATTLDAPEIICGNSDYVVHFAFDEEWAEEAVKTARFSFTKGGEEKYIDVVFSGDSVAAPVLSGISMVLIGVYAGDLRTTTGARVPCHRSVLCGDLVHEEPPEDIYNQLVHEVRHVNAKLAEDLPTITEAAYTALETAQEAEDRAASTKGVYIGSGEMPEGYDIQIDPNGSAVTVVDELIPGSKELVTSGAVELAVRRHKAIGQTQDDTDGSQLFALLEAELQTLGDLGSEVVSFSTDGFLGRDEWVGRLYKIGSRTGLFDGVCQRTGAQVVLANDSGTWKVSHFTTTDRKNIGQTQDDTDGSQLFALLDAELEKMEYTDSESVSFSTDGFMGRDTWVGTLHKIGSTAGVFDGVCQRTGNKVVLTNESGEWKTTHLTTTARKNIGQTLEDADGSQLFAMLDEELEAMGYTDSESVFFSTDGFLGRDEWLGTLHKVGSAAGVFDGVCLRTGDKVVLTNGSGGWEAKHFAAQDPSTT